MTTVGRYDRPFRFTAPDGTVVFEGASFIWYAQEAKNVEASATIGRGEAVTLVQASSVLPRWDYSSTDVDFSGVPISGGTTKGPTLLAVEQCDSATDLGFLGVAAEDIPAGEFGDIITAGACCVKCVNPPTSVVVGAPIIGSATVGSVNTVAPVAIGSGTDVEGAVLGHLIVAPGTTAGLSGSLTQLGALIKPR